MVYTVNTPIYGESDFSVAMLKAWAKSKGAQGDINGYIDGVHAAGAIAGTRDDVIVCQSSDETANWASLTSGFSAAIVKAAVQRWLDEGNPAGVGIWGSAAPTPFTRKPTGFEAGWIHVMEMLAHTGKRIPSQFDDERAIDPHVDRVIDLAANHPNWPNPTTWTIGMLSTPLGGGDYVWAANQAYGKQIAAKLNDLAAYAKAHGEEPTVPDTSDKKYDFGNVKLGPVVDRLIPDNQTVAWDDLGKMVVVGVDQHSMVGGLVGTDGWFRRGRNSDGLTTYGIGNSTDGPALDGVVVRWNDPKGAAHDVDYGAFGSMGSAKGYVSPNRSGWANGGSDGLEGDGPLFVRTFGVNGINKNLVSIERSDGGNIDTPMSPKQFESMCRVTAYHFDDIEVPWDVFPMNPAYGCVTHLIHKETATKDCPFPVVYNDINRIQDRVRAMMKAGQGVEGVPIPPTPDHGKLPYDWTEAQLSARFGKIPRVNADGKITSHGFNLKGAVSNAWIARAASQGIKKVSDIPRPQRWFVLRADKDTTADIIIFEGVGADAWSLYRPDAAVAWRWLDAASTLAPKGVEYSFAA